MVRVKVAVAIADSARTHIHEVAAACRAAGLEHTATLSEVGLLMGSVLAGDLIRLRDVPGVLAVELERRLQLQAARIRNQCAAPVPGARRLKENASRSSGRPRPCSIWSE